MRKNHKSALLFIALITLLGCGARTARKQLERLTVKDTPLRRAIKDGDLKSVDVLLKKGANPNEPRVSLPGYYAVAREGETPLILASGLGQVEILKALLDGGADVNGEDAYGATALNAAIENGRADAVKFLLDRGVNINTSIKKHYFSPGASNSPGKTPLSMAVSLDYQDKIKRTELTDIIKMLIDKGADISVGVRKLPTVKKVLEEKRKAERGSLDDSLENAIVKLDSDTVKSLLEQGANPNARDEDFKPLLSHAVDLGQLEIVELLLKNGADVNAETEGDTALSRAVGYLAIRGGTIYPGHREIAKTLLVHGADKEQAVAYLEKQVSFYSSASIPTAAGSFRKAAQWIIKIQSELAAEEALKPHMPQILADEKAGDEAQKSGNYDEALSRYLEAFQTTSPGMGTEHEERLRKKIIEIAVSMDPLPEVHEEAKRRMVRGQAFVKQADFNSAVQEMQQAANIAPWWATAYFNLAVAQEKAQDFEGAIQSFKLYLLAAPDAEDAGKVQKRIYELEVSKETAERAAPQAP